MPARIMNDIININNLSVGRIINGMKIEKVENIGANKNL